MIQFQRKYFGKYESTTCRKRWKKLQAGKFLKMVFTIKIPSCWLKGVVYQFVMSDSDDNTKKQKKARRVVRRRKGDDAAFLQKDKK